VYFHYCHLFFLVYLSKNLVLTGMKTFFCCTTSAHFLLHWCQVFSSLRPSLLSNSLSSIHVLLVYLLLFIYLCSVALFPFPTFISILFLAISCSLSCNMNLSEFTNCLLSELLLTSIHSIILFEFWTTSLISIPFHFIIVLHFLLWLIWTRKWSESHSPCLQFYLCVGSITHSANGWNSGFLISWWGWPILSFY